MHRQRALFAIHIAAVLFGLTGIFGKLIEGDALAITAGRAGFASAVLYAAMRWGGVPLRHNMGRRHLAVLALASIMLAIHWATFFVSVKIAGVAVATLGFASFPAFITLIERIVFKERASRTEWLILALVTTGLVLVTPSFDFRNHATIGLAWAILSGLTFALFTVINRRAASSIPAQQVACWENLFVFILTLPFGWASLGTLGALDWLWLAILGIACTALSHYLMVSSLMALNARSAGIVIALEPVYAIVFAALLFGQYPSLRMVLGGVLMVGAIIWAGLRQASARKTA
ncbi:DMT family transporter [Allopusillimonas soli]|uniref:DMT family transporter n=1 Tax=Allopusillimonas soli TaxID=659016 RepID=A0A853FBV9_9BURK|nr:DMT family transporter [Allopusillimonas soli]NYT37122.1 DMT family transporter [Allopusillimonas soli]TEA75552.1 DMT family transporter [Allopusillimonas soli]